MNLLDLVKLFHISNVPYIHGYMKQWSLDEPVGLGQTVPYIQCSLYPWVHETVVSR